MRLQNMMFLINANRSRLGTEGALYVPGMGAMLDLPGLRWETTRNASKVIINMTPMI